MNIISKRTYTMSLLPADFILPQSGPMLCGSGGSSPQVARRASTLDPHNGNVASSDTPKLPNELEVSTKNHREDSGDNDGGPLPCTPESNSESELASCPPGNDVLENVTRQLVGRFLTDFTGLSKPGWNESKALSTMKRVVGDILEKHRYTFNDEINKLSLNDKGEDMSFVASVATNLFEDGTTNWGRVVSLVAFAAVMCEHLRRNNKEHCVELVGREISTYLLADQRKWLVQNNSWDGFVEVFRVADPESTVRDMLVTVAVFFAVIGATLALFTRGRTVQDAIPRVARVLFSLTPL